MNQNSKLIFLQCSLCYTPRFIHLIIMLIILSAFYYLTKITMKQNKLTIIWLLLSATILFTACNDSTQASIVNPEIKQVVKSATLDSRIKVKNQTENIHSSPAKYDSYNSSKLSYSLTENKTAALFFHANWCHVCVSLEKNIKRNLSSFPDNSIIYNVNFDKELALRKKYWVTSQTTVVFIDSKWNEISKLVNPPINEISKRLSI